MHEVAEVQQAETIRYNGWTNRETWLVNLWLGNDINSYDFLQQICKKRCETWEKAEELESRFQDELEEMFDVPSLWSDILATSLDRVGWCRIIEANIE